jgi:hypothetical protein
VRVPGGFQNFDSCFRTFYRISLPDGQLFRNLKVDQRIDKAEGSHQQQTGIENWPDSPEAIQLFRPRQNITRLISTGNDKWGFNDVVR